MTKPSTVLKKARKLIEKGWCKGHLVTRRSIKGPVHYCSIGAIDKVGGTDAVRTFLRRVIDTGIVRFNDDPSRRKPQVLRAFDRAIKLAISEGQ